MISAFGVEVVKASRKADAAEASATAGSVFAAGEAVHNRRGARAKLVEYHRNRELAGRAYNVTDQRMARHATKGTGSLPPTQRNVGNTRRALAVGRSFDAKASNAAKASFAASRHAKGAAGAAVALGAAATAIHRRNPGTPKPSFGYR